MRRSRLWLWHSRGEEVIGHLQGAVVMSWYFLFSRSRVRIRGRNMWLHPIHMNDPVHFSEISGDHRLSYGVRILSDALGRELAPLLRETESMSVNPKCVEVDLLACNHHQVFQAFVGSPRNLVIPVYWCTYSATLFISKEICIDTSSLYLQRDRYGYIFSLSLNKYVKMHHLM